MFGGIGKKGGRRDLLLRRKNQKRKEKEKKKEEKENQIQEEAQQEKKKKQQEILFQQKEKSEVEEKKIDQNERQEKKDLPPKKSTFQIERKEKKQQEKQERIEERHEANKKLPPFSVEKKEPVHYPLKREEEKKEEVEKREDTKKNQEIPTPPSTLFPKEEEKTPLQKEQPSEKKEETEEKKEQEDQEEILEYQVITELERLLKNCNYELKQLYVEGNILFKEAESYQTERDLDYVLDEIEKLLSHLKKIKNQLELLHHSYDLDQIYQLHNKELTILIEEYKQQVKSQKQIEGTISDMKRREEYTFLIKRIIEFERMEEDLRQQVEEKKQQMALREEEFSKAKENFLKVEEQKAYIDAYIRDSENKLQQIEQRINEAVEITTKTEIKLHYSLESITKSMILLRMIRKNPMLKANGMAAIQTLVTLDLIKKLLTPEQRQFSVTSYHLTDYKNLILSSLNNVSEVQTMITAGLSELKSLRSYIEEQFGEYKNEIRDYKDLLSSMDKMEIELIERENNMNHIQLEMQNQLKTNNYKVLRYQNVEEKQEMS